MNESEKSKRPKDMTASEMLRKAVVGGESNTSPWTPLGGLIHLLGVDITSGQAAALSALADKIDAELAQARELSLLRGAELWAKANGWPEFKTDEGFGEWLDRCALPRPRFEDGEPVQLGELVDSNLVGAVRVSAIEFTEYETYVKDEPDGDWSTSLEVTTNRLKRPAPDTLGADGLPIKAGETVYMAGSLADTPNDKAADTVWAHGGPLLVLGESDRVGYLICKNDMGVKLDVRPEDLSHTPPDTQERIDGDVHKDACESFGVAADHCGYCNAPRHYDSCDAAKTFDLLRRQRELDKRKGGE